MIQTSARGSMILIVGRMLSTFISAVGTILVARFLGSSKFGAMNIALIPVSIALLFVHNGVRAAVVSYIAEYRHTDKQEKIQEIIVCGLSFSFIVSLSVTLVMLFISGFLANEVFSLPEITPIIRILSLSIFFQSIVNVSTGVIIGFEKMNQSIMIQILQSISKTIIGPLLVYLGLGVAGAAYGYTLPFLVSSFLAVGLVYLDNKNLSFSSKLLSRDTFRLIILYVYPLLLANILAGGTNRILEFILSLNTTTEVMGNYSAAKSLTVLVQFFTSPISTATFPLLSKLNPKNSLFKKVYQNIIKYESIVVFPITCAIIALSEQFVAILYGPSYAQTSLYMQIYMISFFFIAFGRTVNYNILNSQKMTKITFQSTIITLILGLPLGIVLIPRYGIFGRLFIFLTAPTIGQLYSLFWIKKNYGLIPDFENVTKIFISSLMGFLLCKVFLFYFEANAFIELFVGGIIIFFVYLISILLTGALKKENLEDIRTLLKGYEVLAPIIDPVFNVLINIARE
jgi:O-antigen/teichoic acid export membrane protein